MVVGHHPHVVQPAERYRDGVIFYSLGNLVFDQFHRKDTQKGLLASVTFRGTAIERVELWPVDIVGAVPRLVSKEPEAMLWNSGGPGTRGQDPARCSRIARLTRMGAPQRRIASTRTRLKLFFDVDAAIAARRARDQARRQWDGNTVQ